MRNLVFVDFEANGFPDEDGTYRACLTYIQQTKLEMKDIFKKLDKSFDITHWESDPPDKEATFARIWSKYKANNTWKTKLIEDALDSHSEENQWHILDVPTTIDDITSTKHYLCYKADIPHIKRNMRLQFKHFDHTNEHHRKVVLETVFSTTVLSCAVLHMRENEGKIEIIPHKNFAESKSGTQSCYYQVYKQDEHYAHSMSAQRVHNLSEEYLQADGVDPDNILSVFASLMKKNTFFVAHNALADKKYMLNTIQRFIKYYEYQSAIHPENELFKTNFKETLPNMLARIQQPWICTLKRARDKYKEELSEDHDDSSENILAEEGLNENELQDYTLQNLYEFITKTSMPKRHDAQMDVYACARIYCATCKTQPDITQLTALIKKIISDQMVCVKPIDFWRYALLPKFKDDLSASESNRTANAKEWISHARRSREIPHDKFPDMTGEWSWCLKYDGFYVRLKRDSTNKWRICSRSGLEYHPPTSFLQHLPIDLPEGMEIEAELVSDTDQKCPVDARGNAQKRIVKRTQGFGKLHVSSLRSTKDMSVWNGLRLVLFAFPRKDQTFENSFKDGKARIAEHQDKYPHISVCNYTKVRSTQDAIDIFKSVVQMGLEGIVLRKTATVYTNEPSNDHSIYKMKQKIVTDKPQKFKQIIKVGKPDKAEKEYTVPNFQATNEPARVCEFTDSRDIAGPKDQNDFYTKHLKWHEEAGSKMNVWDLNNLGMRHTCFVTDLDLPFEVKPMTLPSQESRVEKLLTETKPFSFIVETVYLFLVLNVQRPPVSVKETTTKTENGVTAEKEYMSYKGLAHVIDIGMLKFTGKTGEPVEAQKSHCQKYTRSHVEVRKEELGETSRLFETLLLFLQHIPYDNKKFVFVVDDQKVLKEFKSLGDELIDLRKSELRRLSKELTEKKKGSDAKVIEDLISQKEIENGFFRGIMNRLEKNDTARKQQVEVLYMQPYRKDKGIQWDTEHVAGKIPSQKKDPTSFYALLSRELEPRQFESLAETQFNLYVQLQNLWNFIGVDASDTNTRRKNATIYRLNPLPAAFTFDNKTIYLDLVFDMQPLKIPDARFKTDTLKALAERNGARKPFYDELERLGQDYGLRRLNKMLAEYSKNNNLNKCITLADFKNIFGPARAVEKDCPDDPVTHTFPYRTDPGNLGKNRFHQAWHMSYAFFKKKEMIARWAVPVGANDSAPASTRQRQVEYNEDAVLPDAQSDQASVQQPRNDMPADSGGQISSVQDGDGKEEEEEYMSEDDNGSETELAADDEKKRKAETPEDENRPKRQTVDQFLDNSDDDEAGVDLTDEQEEAFARNYGQTLYISALLHQLKIYAAE